MGTAGAFSIPFGDIAFLAITFGIFMLVRVI